MLHAAPLCAAREPFQRPMWSTVVTMYVSPTYMTPEDIDNVSTQLHRMVGVLIHPEHRQVLASQTACTIG